MTREEVIRTLKEHKIMFQHDFGWDTSTLEALEMAIEALSTIEQIRWERDIAIEQLKELGYELGEKIRTSEDCISRAEARHLIAETNRIGGISCRAFKTLYNGIDNIPSVTPIRPKGKWVFRRNEKGDYESICTNCSLDSGISYLYNFCPNCGAEMIGTCDE